VLKIVKVFGGLIYYFYICTIKTDPYKTILTINNLKLKAYEN